MNLLTTLLATFFAVEVLGISVVLVWVWHDWALNDTASNLLSLLFALAFTVEVVVVSLALVWIWRLIRVEGRTDP